MLTTKKNLIELVTVLRGYGNRILDGLDENAVKWIPAGTKGRSTQDYFCHIINAEIYWLIQLDHKLEYIDGRKNFEDILKRYRKMGKYLIDSIQNCEEEQMKIIIHKSENDQLIQQGTLGWMIWRTSMHAIHHYAQIAYIRFALDKPPIEDSEFKWTTVMDSIIMLKNC